MWNESEIEALIDRRVQGRLASDRDYAFAENAEQQSLAERKITLQEELAVLDGLAHKHPEAARRAADIREIELPQIIDEIANADDQEILAEVYGVERRQPCVHGHFDCATYERGPCANEEYARRLAAKAVSDS